MATAAAERKAAERINRQVAPWRYRAELEHAVGVAAGRALARGDGITCAELTKRTVVVLVQRNKNPANLGLAGVEAVQERQSCHGIGRHSDAGASTARRPAGSGSCAKSAAAKPWSRGDCCPCWRCPW